MRLLAEAKQQQLMSAAVTGLQYCDYDQKVVLVFQCLWTPDSDWLDGREAGQQTMRAGSRCQSPCQTWVQLLVLPWMLVCLHLNAVLPWAMQLLDDLDLPYHEHENLALVLLLCELVGDMRPDDGQMMQVGQRHGSGVHLTQECHHH